VREKNISKIINFNGEENFNYNPVSVPIYETSIFSFEDYDSLKKALSHEEKSHIYTRGYNPTIEVLEKKVAALEYAESAKLFSSGIAAISAATMAFLKCGDSVICVNDCYGWTKTLFGEYLQRFGIETIFVDGENTGEIFDSVKDNTKLIYLESPTSFTFKIQNIKEITSFAKKRNIKTVIDNSWATPIFQNPIKMGVDIVVHSASKYIGGHSDVVAGIVTGSKNDIDHIFKTEFLNIGAIPGPFEAWLLLRGLRTLPIRMERHMKSTQKIISFLLNCPQIKEVIYPYHESHPQYDLAKKQMSGGSGLLSIRLKTTDENKIRNFTNTLKFFKKAVSWGGYESLIIPCIATNPANEKSAIIRMHIGLEEPELLTEDLARAFKKISC